MALPIGTVLDGKFKIVQILGEGGMGTVYKVELVGRPGYYRAIKELLINPNTSPEDRKSAIERFDKEIDLLFSLKHPRIPTLMLSFQERGNYYFVMEFVPGRSLDKMLEDANAPLDETKIVTWMMQVCEALTYIHSRTPPIILRDLKPGNIMVTPSGDVQLIDFGIARRFDPNKRTNTENLGTISYASPEHLGSLSSPGQRRSAQNPGRLVQTDARSDIYSLGATMYHLLTNYEPDPIQTPTSGSMLAKNPRLRTIQVNGRTVCPVEQVVIKAMQQDSTQRFQNAEAMRVALLHCLPNSSPVSTIQIPAVTANSTIVVPAGSFSNSIQPRPIASNGASLVCPKCGFVNRPGAKFCKRDGQPLGQGASVVPPQMRPAAPIRARPISPASNSYVAPAPIQPRPIQNSVQAQPAQPIKARPITVDHYRQGLQALNDKKYQEAVNEFKQAAPSYDVVYNLGRAYRQYAQVVRSTSTEGFVDNMRMAAEQFEKAITYKSDAFDAYFQLGMCYHDLELYPKATDTFKKAQQIAPTDSAVYYQLGLLAARQGLLRDAERYLRDGLKFNQEHALILVALGRLYMELKQTADAIAVLRRATTSEPTLWEGWYELGRAHMRAREWKLALSALEQARINNPGVSEIYSAMATSFVKSSRKPDARPMVTEALRLNPNNAEALRLKKQV